MHTTGLSRTRRPGWLVATLLGTTALATVLAGCTATATASSQPTSTATSPPHTSTTPAKPVVLPASVAIKPAAGAHNVNPAAAATVSVAHGRISKISLTNARGTVVTGTLSSDHATWTASESLGYGKTYTWSGTATGWNGKALPIRGSFTTVTPSRQISGQLNVGDNQTYGIAMPVSLTFSSAVTNRAAVQKALTVTTSKPTTGTWAWLDDQTVHWRPETYYAPGTRVTVAANLYGVAFAPGVYGRSDVSAHFTIGRSQIVKADTRTHRMVVITNGRRTADFPASFGLDSDPGRNTHSGVHVVMTRSPTYFMSNPAYHYANVEVHWAVRISNNGEFIHAAPWSVGDQGRRNVSHGCVNLSTANALKYYNSVLPGDPVQITGSPIKLGPSDGDYYDWTMTWAQWQAKSAVRA